MPPTSTSLAKKVISQFRFEIENIHNEISQARKNHFKSYILSDAEEENKFLDPVDEIFQKQ